ncbi:MAG: NADH-quinone oxidoreductase subunit N [Gemmataceae bacterium]|nr:NADH-quinone oxidoreductase subunit N [Gemmataceae bacterium]
MFLDPNTIGKISLRLQQDCFDFLPELILCGTIVLMLFLRLFTAMSRWHLGLEALTLTLVALAVAWVQWQSIPMGPDGRSDGISRPIFGGADPASGLLVYDNFTIYLRLFLLSFTALIIWLSLLTGIPDAEDSGDFYCLLLGATVGMCLMASANHLLMVFIGIEMASLPSYALAGFLKGRRQSSEASLKYVVYGGGAAGVMLYGISLIAGKFGTGYLPDLAKVIPEVASQGLDPVLMLGMLFILVGIAFKLAAVPFHFWCPDVFEGAAAEVAGFLSVASKGAALALLARLVLVLTAPATAADPTALTRYLVPTLAFFAAITATFGNLAAYSQTNLKRLLAYSTIAHAGYMMMGLATLTKEGASAVLFYLIVYLVMNLGAFAVVAFLRNQTGSEDLASFRGLIHRAPVLVITLAIFLLSLLGLPPLAGFAAKFQIFWALFKAGQFYANEGQQSLSTTMYALLVIGGVNTVFSLVYYVRVLKVMILEKPLEEVEGRPSVPLAVPPLSAFYATLLAALIFVVGIFWNPLAVQSEKGVERLRDPLSTVDAKPATDSPALAGGPAERMP